MIHKKILERELKNINEIEVSSAFAGLEKFKNSIENIKKAKEESYQYGFLEDFFVKSLGYILNPSPNYNLTTEFKNESNNKKADGSILINGKPIAVIELKSVATKSMDKIVDQAFSYKNNHPSCHYVITSNFEKMRFYIEYSNEFIEFDLFNLRFEDFKKLYLLVGRNSILNDLPKKWRDESKYNQVNIANEFYKKFSNLRTRLFDEIANINKIEKLDALSLSQKLLDRAIFIFFAGDRGLIDSKTVDDFIARFKNDLEGRDLYHFVKLLFKAIDIGNAKIRIPPYNGGLFANDEILDSLKISDSLLLEILNLSSYDFESDIDVNILGHIFENSLDELEKIREDLIGGKFDSNRSKRKRDGIFYTPNYITEFIVENSVGAICEKRKAELELINFEDASEEKIKSYLDFLTNLKIVDPACGSGAFLNMAFNYLFVEYKHCYDILNNFAMKKGDLFLSSDFDVSILENNLFGVDLNAEAVEIAKLSLWLKTAKRNRKLTDLNKNIKVGNSLISHSESQTLKQVTKAFDWQNEFPDIFAKGGFDIVIGNPPYGANIEHEKTFFEIQSGESAILFMQLARQLLKNNGIAGFIVPKPFLYSSSWEEIRSVLKEEISHIVDCGKVWDEVKLEQVIYISHKLNKIDNYKNYQLEETKFKELSTVKKDLIEKFGFFVNGVNQREIEIALKIKKQLNNLFDISAECSRGGAFQHAINSTGEIQVLGGINLARYEIKDVKGFISSDFEISNDSFIKANSILVQRIIAHIQNPTDHIKLIGTISDNLNNIAIVNTIYQITFDEKYSNKYILALLHSNLINWFIYRFVFAKAIRTMDLSNHVIKRIPIPEISENEQKPFVERVDKLVELYAQLQQTKNEFLETLELEKIPQKLDNFAKLEFDEFIIELSKAKKIKLSDKKLEREFKKSWKNIFDEDKSKVQNLLSQISKIEHEIDREVYKLYALNEDEIKIIENI